MADWNENKQNASQCSVLFPPFIHFGIGFEVTRPCQAQRSFDLALENMTPKVNKDVVAEMSLPYLRPKRAPSYRIFYNTKRSRGKERRVKLSHVTMIRSYIMHVVSLFFKICQKIEKTSHFQHIFLLLKVFGKAEEFFNFFCNICMINSQNA